jgi:hypothetical protein
MGHMLPIGLIAAVLQSFILLDRRRVGEMQLQAGILQAIDQSIPVVGRLDHDACHLVAPARQNADDLRDLVQALPRHNMIGIVDNRDNAVVGMQIDSAVHHPCLLVAKSDSTIANSL